MEGTTDFGTEDRGGALTVDCIILLKDATGSRREKKNVQERGEKLATLRYGKENSEK